ncbi:MAG: hypothetical protein AVDCRST_MAG93-8865 [uncultured Chloroflexia bacterium]|uniref:Uncharacterized protein n=1 Tax=uncultured Chloroflexia bacterium TaxID=1672391 RepID=A0A6J4N4U1_9CHLR|nr:MAG: hypothetical protein AVDCRST_MAG93-8865 [uncultured Chloroflexia bacterium]
MIEQVLDVRPALRALAYFVLPLEPRVLDQIRKVLVLSVGDFVQGRGMEGNSPLGLHLVGVAPDLIVAVSLLGPPVGKPPRLGIVGVQALTSSSDSCRNFASYSCFATRFISSP